MDGREARRMRKGRRERIEKGSSERIEKGRRERIEKREGDKQFEEEDLRDLSF